MNETRVNLSYQDFMTVIISLRVFSGIFSRTDVHFRPSQVYWDGSSVSSRIDPRKDIIDQLNDFGVLPADLSPESIQVEYRKFGASIQNILIGVAIGGLIGVLVGASLMRLYIEFRPKNSTQ